MEYDYSVLRGRIKEKFGSESALASTIGMNRSTFSQKSIIKVNFPSKT